MTVSSHGLQPSERSKVECNRWQTDTTLTNHVIDFEDAPGGLSCQRYSRGGDQEGLDYILLEDVSDGALWGRRRRRRRWTVVTTHTHHQTFLTLIPAVFSPWACLFLSSVTTAIGLSPAFSANVYGMTSIASANALKQYPSVPVSVWACSISLRDTSISGAPPPAIRALTDKTWTAHNYHCTKLAQ